MKKVITIILIMGMLFFIVGTTVQASNTYDLEFKIKNHEKGEELDLYLLLPKKYILFAIRKANLDIEYEGAKTLKKYFIPNIGVEKQKVQDELYIENETEYVQILLSESNRNVYTFSILADYPDRDMKYRVINEKKDYIIHIDNFKVENGKCKIEYNDKENTAKQPNRIYMPFGVKILITILIVILIIGGISCWKKQRS